MTLIEYLKAKYPSGNFGMMSLEARVFGIKYPLQNGWLQKHQNDEISAAQIRELKSLLRKSDKEINKRTLEFLEREFADDHIDLIKQTIKPTFFADQSGKFNNQLTALNQNDFIIIRRSEIAVMVRDAVADCLASGDGKVTDSATVPDQASVDDVGLKEAEVSIVIKLKALVY